MPDLPTISEEFRSWVRAGLSKGARWMVVMYDPDDFLDYPDYFSTDAELEAFRDAEGAFILNTIELSGPEEEILDRVRRQWAEEAASSGRRQGPTPLFPAG